MEKKTKTRNLTFGNFPQNDLFNFFLLVKLTYKSGA